MPYRTKLWAIALMGSTIAISAIFFITDDLVRLALSDAYARLGGEG